MVNELEAVLNKAAKKPSPKKTSAHQFTGLLTNKRCRLDGKSHKGRPLVIPVKAGFYVLSQARNSPGQYTKKAPAPADASIYLGSP
jgi:hypothetical protein